MRAVLLSVSLAWLLGGEAFAQQAGLAPDQRIVPVPPPAEADKPSDYLKVAQNAVAMGYADRAEEALERAQTRLLDRSVPLFQTGNPSVDPMALQITHAREALAAHDRAACLRLIQTAIDSAVAQGL